MSVATRRPSDDFSWVDDLSDDELLGLLAAEGEQVDGDPSHARPLPSTDAPAYQLLPLGSRWLRLEQDTRGRLFASFIPDARYPNVTDGRPPVRLDDDGEDLDGWMVTRSDIDGAGERWISVLRRPEREAYVALLYDAGEEAPQRRLVVSGVYPDVSLVDDGQKIVFVEPDRESKGGQRAVLASADPDDFDGSRLELSASPQGGIGVRPCSVRRFFKISHGLRSERVWDLVDARASRPRPFRVPGAIHDPDLFDVALLAGEPVLVSASNRADGSWELQASRIDRENVLRTWVCATGSGTVRALRGEEDYALVRLSVQGEEFLRRIDVGGFSHLDETPPVLRSPGLLDVNSNRLTPSIGFAAVELSGGGPPFPWYFNHAGEPLNDPAAIERRRARQSRSARFGVTSTDEFAFHVDLRWAAEHGDAFAGPVVLLLYGAYGIDIDLDTDPQLGLWLERGYAVATAHVRGGGPEARHLAGTRAKRHRSLEDAASAIRALRAGVGPVTATEIVVIGASAGGFLTATTLSTSTGLVDAAVIVNGFVDPLTSLLRGDTQTTASDEDEWGNPASNAHDLEALLAITPVDTLRPHGAEVLVVVSGRDVRVNPRQGLKWALRSRSLGDSVEIWFDPDGAHDCWGAGMAPTAMVDWVTDALARANPTRTVTKAS